MSLKRKAADAVTTEAKKPKGGTINSFFAPVNGAKKDSTTTVTAKFNKAAWVEKLTDEQKELLKLEIDTLHESWLAHLKDELVTKEFLDLKRFLKQEEQAGKKIFPPKEDIYSW
jgi:uracil-DNA glycosylase